ncbi:NAD-dependent epimerase/dehydratase family protein [Pedobacter sp. JCM 36344]|uniref:NAD-dependent epimerase/dehydratase family protein n=1 Tax=Pedobacter sp. JCM 36344 TaxID=3374280 RepID=UPI00397974B9
MRNKVIITGASGFVGTNFCKYLSKEKIYYQELNRELLSNDLESIFDLEADTLIHLAGKAHDLKSTTNSEEYYEVNYELTKSLYDSFLKSNLRKFVFVSSIKAVADSAVGILDEATVPDPKTHYGRSKLMAENYIIAQTLPPDKSFYILRPCMIHGPENKGNLNMLYKLISKGFPYPLASYKNKRSFLSIDNLCFILKELIINNKIPSGTYNIADNEALLINDVVTILSEAVGRKVKLWFIPKQILEILARIGDFLKLPITTERLSKLTENFLVDNRKIRDVLIKELPVNAKAGMIKTAKSFSK